MRSKAMGPLAIALLALTLAQPVEADRGGASAAPKDRAASQEPISLKAQLQDDMGEEEGAQEGEGQQAESQEAEPTAEEEAPVEYDEPEPEDAADVDTDAMRDPFLSKFLPRERRLIDWPNFTMETGGKIQVQYYDADSDDPNNDDEWMLRRFRPFLMGRIAQKLQWKFELELSSEISALDFDVNDLDIRDMFIRYSGFERDGRRLTLGSQKAPFSRAFMHPSTSLLFPERTFVGQTKAGVPDRVLGLHLRSPTASEKLVFWTSLGSASHKQDVRGIRFEQTVGASSDANVGWLLAGRADLRPSGSFWIGKDTHYDVSVAAYYWANDWSRNPFTENGESVDPERADLDTATGLELSGRVWTGDFTLSAQYNLIRGETLVDGFTGGVYVDGETELESGSVQTGISMANDWVQVVAAFSRIEANGYIEPWDEVLAGFNLDTGRYLGRVQISHAWITSRFGMPGEDYQETRIQLQYIW